MQHRSTVHSIREPVNRSLRKDQNTSSAIPVSLQVNVMGPASFEANDLPEFMTMGAKSGRTGTF